MKYYSFQLILFIFLLTTPSKAQVITGIIKDSITHESLPFTNIHLKNSPEFGCISDVNGAFELNTNGNVEQDSIVFSFIGYQKKIVAVKDFKSKSTIALVAQSEVLDAFELSPLTAKEFFKLAIQSIEENAPDSTFSSKEYYAEKVIENGKFLNFREAIVGSYYGDLLDTSKHHQHQISLFREAETLEEVLFMRKRLDKKARKYKKKHGTEQPDSLKSISIDPKNMFGGIDYLYHGFVLKNSNIFSEKNIDKFKYTFHDKPIYDDDNRELTLIHLKSKGRIDKVKVNCKVYIDRETFGIKQIETEGIQKIPNYIRPILLVLGIGIQNPTFKQTTKFQRINNKWYPDDLYYTIDLHLTEKYLFSKNIKSHMVIQQILDIQKVDTKMPKSIIEDNLYDNKKAISDQVHPIEGLNWTQFKLLQI